MNILLWLVQILISLFCAMGAAWRFSNYDQAAMEIASIQALPRGVWNLIGIIEIVCALGLILPGLLRRRKVLIPIAAAFLSIEMLLVSVLHLKYFGFQMQASNPAAWTLFLAALSAFVAYGRRRA